MSALSCGLKIRKLVMNFEALVAKQPQLLPTSIESLRLRKTIAARVELKQCMTGIGC
jgi:hypothetical protein